MALWKETGSTPNQPANGTPAAGSGTTVTELHGKIPDRPAADPLTTSETQKRPAVRVPGVESVIAAELAIEGKIVDVKAASITVASGARMRGHVEFGWDEKYPAAELKGTTRSV